MLVERRMIGSMGAKGNSYDNAAMERFVGTPNDERSKDESLRGLRQTAQAT